MEQQVTKDVQYVQAMSHYIDDPLLKASQPIIKRVKFNNDTYDDLEMIQLP